MISSEKWSKTVEYLNFDSEEQSRQKELYSGGMQEIAPVILPEEEYSEMNSHLGWPVATMVDDTLIVVFSNPTPDPQRSWSLARVSVVRSADGGKTWSNPVNLGSGKYWLSMRAIGADSSGKVIISTGQGVFFSVDRGITWKSVDVNTDAGSLLSPGAGPRIIEHSDHGLIMASNSTRFAYLGMVDNMEWRLNFGLLAAEGLANNGLNLLTSKDGGATWDEIRVSEWHDQFRPAEPCLFTMDDKFGVVTRNQSALSEGSGNNKRTWGYFAQYIPYNPTGAKNLEDIKFINGLTNIFQRRMDTMDVIYNPVSKRLEAVISKRNEGFPYADNAYQTLSLWSIDPDKLFAGYSNWRFECVLMRSKGPWSRSRSAEAPPREGLHPGGTVIDAKRGLQHIFIYAGNRTHGGPDNGKTGIFRISRTLETDKLKESIREMDSFHKVFGIRESFGKLDDWTLNGEPLAIRVSPVDQDVVEWRLKPVPGGVVEAGESGLHIKTCEPGYYGLHSEKSIILHNFTLNFKARVERYADEGDSLGVAINYGAQRLNLIIGSEGIYNYEAKGNKRFYVKQMQMDNEWHEWSVRVENRIAHIKRDGILLAKFTLMLDDLLGESDAPALIYARTVKESDYAEAYVEYFNVENIEEP